MEMAGAEGLNWLLWRQEIALQYPHAPAARMPSSKSLQMEEDYRSGQGDVTR